MQTAITAAFYRQDHRYCNYSGQFWSFRPTGRHIAPITIKFGMTLPNLGHSWRFVIQKTPKILNFVNSFSHIGKFLARYS